MTGRGSPLLSSKGGHNHGPDPPAQGGHPLPSNQNPSVCQTLHGCVQPLSCMHNTSASKKKVNVRFREKSSPDTNRLAGTAVPMTALPLERLLFRPPERRQSKRSQPGRKSDPIQHTTAASRAARISESPMGEVFCWLGKKTGGLPETEPCPTSLLLCSATGSSKETLFSPHSSTPSALSLANLSLATCSLCWRAVG